METKFQTSFIPKKPITTQVAVRTSSPISVFFLIGVVLFIGSIAGAGGIIVWQQQLDAKQESLKAEVEKQKKQFDSDFLGVLKQKTNKISSAKELLNNHLSVSDVFNMIGAITVENVRYKNFKLSYDPKGNKPVDIAMSGEAKNYETIAYQADVLADNKYLHNAYLASPQLQANGYVSFALTGIVDPSDIKYVNAFGGLQSSYDQVSPDGGASAVDNEENVNNSIDN